MGSVAEQRRGGEFEGAKIGAGSWRAISSAARPFNAIEPKTSPELQYLYLERSKTNKDLPLVSPPYHLACAHTKQGGKITLPTVYPDHTALRLPTPRVSHSGVSARFKNS